MKIVISNHSEQPIYAQIKDQLKEQIMDGSIPEGTTLPSIRKLAKEINVSVITTSRAYSDLEAEGYIVSVQGRGSMVLPQNNPMMREQCLQKIEADLTHAISAAKILQLSPKELHDMLDVLLQDV